MEWPKIITERAPKRLEFKVFESVHDDLEYKESKGFVYNDFMFKEALNEYDQFGRWIKYNDWFDD